MKLFNKTYKIEYSGEKLEIRKFKYSDGRIKLQSYIPETKEPFASLTTNIPSYNDILDKDDIILDCNNVPGIDKALLKEGLISECLGRLQSGWCTYPVHKWKG